MSFVLKLNMQEDVCNVTQYEERKLPEGKSKPPLPPNIENHLSTSFGRKKG